MEYYIIEQGKKMGPLTLQQLEVRGINPTTYVWKNGFPNWLEAKNIPELAMLLQNTPPDLPTMPRTWLLEAILVTVFCCLPFGIAGIVNALKISEAFQVGNYSQAQSYSVNAKSWVILGLEVAAIITLTIIVITLIIAFSNYGFRLDLLFSNRKGN